MKSLKLAMAMATAGMLAVTANAQYLDFKLTAYQQGLMGEEIAPDVYRYTIDRVRITTADILDLIASHYDTNFPPGARLYEPDEGNTLVLNTNGDVLLSIDSEVFELTGYDGVYAGVDKQTPKGSFSFKAFTYVTISLAVDEGNHFDLGGLTSVQQVAKYGDGTFKFMAKVKSAAGHGYLDGKHSIFSGTLTGRDSGVMEDGAAASGNASFTVDTFRDITLIPTVNSE